MADMRLINANDIPWRLGCNDDGRTIVYARATDVDAMPTIDAVPVVRCKDCEYCENEECANPYIWMSDCAHLWTQPDDFCSYGERKDDGICKED